MDGESFWNFMACLFLIAFGAFLGSVDMQSEVEACFKRNIPISECQKINSWDFVSLVKDKDIQP